MTNDKTTADYFRSCLTVMVVRWALCVLLSTVFPGRASAQTETAPNPFRELAPPGGEATDLPPCIGFHPRTRQWGAVGHLERNYLPTCPDDTAIMAVRSRSHRSGASSGQITGWCCPLPADALLPDILYTPENCPPGYVATGGSLTFWWAGQDEFVAEKKDLRCTRLNTAKYLLGPARLPALVDNNPPNALKGYVADLEWDTIREKFKLRRAAIPLGLRYGLGRLSYESWEEEYCLGNPIGSLLTGRIAGRGCAYLFRQLQFRGGPTGPVPKSPAPVIPRCDALEDIFDSSTRCVVTER